MTQDRCRNGSDFGAFDIIMMHTYHGLLYPAPLTVCAVTEVVDAATLRVVDGSGAPFLVPQSIVTFSTSKQASTAVSDTSQSGTECGLACHVLNLTGDHASADVAIKTPVSRSLSLHDRATKHSAAELMGMLGDRDAEIGRLHSEMAEKDALLDEMQQMLRGKAVEADVLLEEAIQVANEVDLRPSASTRLTMPDEAVSAGAARGEGQAARHPAEHAGRDHGARVHRPTATTWHVITTCLPH